MAVGRVFPNEIDRIFNAPGGPIGKEARSVAIDVASTAEFLSTVELGIHPGDRPRTGRLKSNWRVRVVGRSTHFEVYNPTPYVAAIDQGAQPHLIAAKKTSYLRFRGRDGRWRTVKMVRHPGNPAFKFLERAAIQVMTSRYGSIRVV